NADRSHLPTATMELRSGRLTPFHSHQLLCSSISRCNRAMHGGQIAVAVRGFSREKQRVGHRFSQLRWCLDGSSGHVAVGSKRKRIRLPISNKVGINALPDSPHTKL